jgi:hypothetical protein
VKFGPWGNYDRERKHAKIYRDAEGGGIFTLGWKDHPCGGSATQGWVGKPATGRFTFEAGIAPAPVEDLDVAEPSGEAGMA